jgi:hypothetical protein
VLGLRKTTRSDGGCRARRAGRARASQPSRKRLRTNAGWNVKQMLAPAADGGRRTTLPVRIDAALAGGGRASGATRARTAAKSRIAWANRSPPRTIERSAHRLFPRSCPLSINPQVRGTETWCAASGRRRQPVRPDRVNCRLSTARTPIGGSGKEAKAIRQAQRCRFHCSSVRASLQDNVKFMPPSATKHSGQQGRKKRLRGFAYCSRSTRWLAPGAGSKSSY